MHEDTYELISNTQTTVTVTATGRGAFARHVATLQEIIAGRQV